MTTPIANVDNTTLNNLTPNLDTGDVADPALRKAAFQYIYAEMQTIINAYNAFVGAGGIATGNLADLSVTTAKLADLAVTTGKIPDLAIVTAKINDLAVTAGKIAVGTITSAQIADLSIATGDLADALITTAKLADLNVTTGKFADASVTLAKMAAASVGTSQLVDGSVTGAKIAPATITADKFVAGALNTDTQNGLLITALSAETTTGMINVVKKYGFVGDGATDNTAAFAALAAAVNASGGKCTIYFPPGIYNFTPAYTSSNAWRLAVEMVDVQNVTIIGWGVTLQQIKQSYWKAGEVVAPSYGNQEGPIQFRSTTLYGCKNIRIHGLRVIGQNVPYDAGTGDGGCFGFAFRGVSNVYLNDVYAYGWGTDGLYLGASYSDTYKGRYAKIVNSEFDANTRQACSVVGMDYCNFTNDTFSNTTGGSFGHGIDFEPNVSLTQKGMAVTGCTFIDNQRGALNFIRTNDAEVSDCNIYETLANGAIYSDGDADSISIDNCRINTSKAALYIAGSNVTNLSLTNSKIMTTGLPNNLATIRINATGTATNVKYIKVRGNRFEGTGGFLANMDGDFYFEDNTMLVSKQASSSADCFALTGNGTGKNYIRRNKIVINTDVVCTLKDCTIVDGVFEDNDLSSHVNAPYSIQDYNGGRVLTVGHNIFSTYFYYKGAVSQLDLKVEGTITEMISGEFGLSTRKVHGGRYRVTGGIGALVGDVTKNTTNFTASIAVLEYICTVAGSPGTWIATQWRTLKGTSAARPTPNSYDIGVDYLDTTLSANGKPIKWNGTLWVDSSGASV